LFIAGICILTITNYLFLIPDWREPIANEAYPIYLYQTGFSATRTSWTPAIALFFITNLYYFFHEKKMNNKILFLIAAILILTSQIFSGGRTGLVISLAAIAYYVFIKINPKIIIISFLLIVILVIPQFDVIIKTARLEHIDFTSFETLNRFSTGRLIQWVWGIDKFLQDYNFLIGAGFDRADVVYLSEKYGDVEIHNFWINIAVRGGIIFLLFYILFTLHYITKAINVFKKERKAELFMLIIICGLFGTLIEPALILGKVQTTMVWWVAIAAIDVIASKQFYKEIKNLNEQ
jgi:membrane protein implicated in regulation of membrane protease activity